MSLNSVCVFCGSRPGSSPSFVSSGQELGRAIAKRGMKLVYGGGRVGIMGAVANAALEAGGYVTGVMPGALGDREFLHDGLSELHVVETMHERKAMMERLSEGFIAAPGGFGTYEELFEMITWSQLGIHRKPIGLLDVDGFFAPMRALVDHGIDSGFIPPEQRNFLHVSEDPGELLELMAQYKPAEHPRRWITRAQT